MVKKNISTLQKQHIYHIIMLFYVPSGMNNKTRSNLARWNSITTELDHTVFTLNELKMLLWLKISEFKYHHYLSETNIQNFNDPQKK